MVRSLSTAAALLLVAGGCRGSSVCASPLSEEQARGSLALDGIHQVGERNFQVARGCARRYLTELASRGDDGTCLVLALDHGRPTGLKLRCIRPHGVFGRMGFQQGDVWTTLQGLSLSDPESALRIYQIVQALPARTELTVVRAGRLLSFTVSMEESASRCLAFEPTGPDARGCPLAPE